MKGFSHFSRILVCIFVLNVLVNKLWYANFFPCFTYSKLYFASFTYGKLHSLLTTVRDSWISRFYVTYLLVHPWMLLNLDSSENVTKFHCAFVQFTCSLAYWRYFVCMAGVNFDFLKGPWDLTLSSQSHTWNVLSFHKQWCNWHTDFLSMFWYCNTKIALVQMDRMHFIWRFCYRCCLFIISKHQWRHKRYDLQQHRK
jgi:hypothetical protein